MPQPKMPIMTVKNFRKLLTLYVFTPNILLFIQLGIKAIINDNRNVTIHKGYNV